MGDAFNLKAAECFSCLVCIVSFYALTIVLHVHISSHIFLQPSFHASLVFYKVLQLFKIFLI